MLNNCPSFVAQNVSLAPYTWFKTGGNAQFFAQPKSTDEALLAVTWALSSSLPITVLGEGANVLISDNGVKGLVIHLQNRSIIHDAHLLHVDGGASVDQAIDYALEHNLGGLENFRSIPGSFGGAVAMNIHYFDALLSDLIETVTYIDLITGKLETKSVDTCNFGYNKSFFLSHPSLIVNTKLKLTPLTPLETAYARGKSDEIRRQRTRRYPPERTCGSFFRNFLPHEYEHAKGETKVPYVAYYLESVGVKGQLSYNHASVFALHANMLVSSPGATSTDICKLAQIMQQKVYDRFGLWPVPECKLLGFEKTLFYQKTIKNINF